MIKTTEAVRENARPLTGAVGDYDPLIEMIGDARFVLLGEASHGTHEFYRERAQITKQLITEKGFTAVAVTERASHYFYARMPDQFDAVLHFDETRAVEPLERTTEWETGEVWETFPYGM